MTFQHPYQRSNDTSNHHSNPASNVVPTSTNTPTNRVFPTPHTPVALEAPNAALRRPLALPPPQGGNIVKSVSIELHRIATAIEAGAELTEGGRHADAEALRARLTLPSARCARSAGQGEGGSFLRNLKGAGTAWDVAGRFYRPIEI